jgi:RHS repeat-associated protein
MRVLTATGDALYYLHSDHLGSTSLTTNSSGGEVARQTYYPYGQVRSGGGLPTDVGFTGQRLDSYIKLIQMGARWYDPEIGRWLSPDTVVPDGARPQSLNRYSYVENNPVLFIDPTGHDRDFGVMDKSDDDYLRWLGKVYSKSDWQQCCAHIPFGQFVQAYEAHEFYMANPEVAFRDSLGEETDAYMWARQYSENVLHNAFEPYADELIMDKIQEAYGLGDVELWYTLVLGLAISEGMSDEFEGSRRWANSAADASRLAKSLASQQQMWEPGLPIAGPGTKRPFRDALRVAAEYGGKPEDWVKMTSRSYRAMDGTQFETHWVENMHTGVRVEFKTRFIR